MTDPRPDADPPPTSRRNLLRWGTLGAGAVVLAGLAGHQLLTQPSGVIRLGIAPGTQTFWRYVAQRKDALLTPKGYDLDFQNFPDEASLRAAYLAGKLDVIASLTPTVASVTEAGTPSRLFLPMAWLREGYPFVVDAASSIASLRELVGRRVATYPLDHPGMAYWRGLALATAGVDLAALKPTETLQSDEQLLQRKVDAACVGGSQWAVLQRDAIFRKLTDLQTTWSQFSGRARLLIFGGYIARQDFLDQNAQFARDFADAHRQAFQAYNDDRPAFLAVATQYAGGPPMTVADNQAQATYLGLDDVQPARLTIDATDVGDYQTLFNLMTKGGYLKSPVASAASLFYQPTA